MMVSAEMIEAARLADPLGCDIEDAAETCSAIWTAMVADGCPEEPTLDMLRRAAEADPEPLANVPAEDFPMIYRRIYRAMRDARPALT